MDWRVLVFTLAATLATAVAVGVLPAFSASRHAAGATLKESGRGATAGPRHRRVRGALVAVEIALALMLLTGATLLMRSFAQLQHAELGVRASHTLTFRIPEPAGRGHQIEPGRTTAYLEQIVERVRAVPGVRMADATSHLPLGGGGQGKHFTIAGRPAPSVLSKVPIVSVRQEGAASLQAMGVPLVSGRFFSEHDDLGAVRVAIVNQTLVRRFFADEQPIGKVISLAPPDHLAPPEHHERAGGPFVRWTIVGVVADVRYRQPTQPTEAVVYVPYRQRTRQALMGWSPEFIVVRTDGDPVALVPGIRTAIRAAAPQQPLAEIRTMEQIVDDSLGDAKLSTSLVGLFSAIALMLAAIGIYGVVSSSVAARTHELGVRMALGANPRAVVWLVLQQTLTLASVAVAAGLIASAAFARAFTSQLYGVRPSDAVTFVSAPAVLTAVVVLAAWLPARRAARIDPVVALRTE